MTDGGTRDAGPVLPDLLDAILGATRRALAVRAAARGQADLERAALKVQPRGDGFEAALGRPGRVNVIAECKRRSPSAGVLREAYDPGALAAAYEQAGAAAVSVLTEPMFFDGSIAHLEAVRRAVTLPLLCKDFFVEEYQLLEARAAGADAALLIVSALDDESLGRLLRAAARYELAALVEVHDAVEARRALAAGARIVGVNNRNLRTLEVDLAASRTVIQELPPGVIRVAESGLRTRQDLRGLRDAGYEAFLVGEHLMRSADPGGALAALIADGPVE